MIARARALAPALAERAADCEKARSVPRATVDDFRAAGLHRMMQPARYGGFELGWDVLCETAIEFGRGCAHLRRGRGQRGLFVEPAATPVPRRARGLCPFRLVLGYHGRP
jgi:alkylation response protein AidB-like acyl-CoA dehydrogenase